MTTIVPILLVRDSVRVAHFSNIVDNIVYHLISCGSHESSIIIYDTAGLFSTAMKWIGY